MVGLEQRQQAGLHEPASRRLPFPRAGAQPLHASKAPRQSTSLRSCRPGIAPGGPCACYALLLIAGVLATDRIQRRRLILKERERSLLRETKLRAETAEAQTKALRADNERKKNIELLSEIGKQITASLDIETIFHNLYQHVNQLVDATVFGVGIYHPDTQQIEYRLAYEEGKHYAPYTRDTSDKDQLPVWCIENRQPVFINDVTVESSRYIGKHDASRSRLEDGSVSAEPLSLIYLPLIAQDRVLGIITVQSFRKERLHGIPPQHP